MSRTATKREAIEGLVRTSPQLGYAEIAKRTSSSVSYVSHLLSSGRGANARGAAASGVPALSAEPVKAARKRDRAALDALVASETQSRRRGHRFYPAAAQWDRIPTVEDVYRMEDVDSATVHAHYFSAGTDHYVVGVDDDGMAFGYADMGYPEWGSFYLPELEEVRTHGGLNIVERDCYWSKGPANEVIPKYS